MNILQNPLTIKSLTIPNRIVMAPMTRSKSKKHIPGPDVAAYYKRRAEGGVGLIITEGTVIGHKAGHGYPDVPNFYGDEALAGWKNVLAGVHQAGGKIFPQIWHVGSVRQIHQCRNPGVDNPQGKCCCDTSVPGYAPSKIPHPAIKNAEIPHEMSVQDIKEVVEAFAQAAEDAKRIGFDGVEIHGAHGYLIDQFFWDKTNQRKDQYGGATTADRVLFAVEVIQAVRKRVGPDFPIDFRFSQWKLGDYSAKLVHTPQELEAFLTPLANAGVDIFHCSTRRFWEPEFPDSTLNLAGWTKKLTGKPVITVGSIGLDNDFIGWREGGTVHPSQIHLKDLTAGVEGGQYDLAAVGRALLGDPAWFHKTTTGRFDEIKPFTQDSLKTLN